MPREKKKKRKYKKIKFGKDKSYSIINYYFKKNFILHYIKETKNQKTKYF